MQNYEKMLEYDFKLMHNSYDSIFNFQLSTFNLIETQQLHIVYFQRCNWYVSTLIFNFQLSTFNFQFDNVVYFPYYKSY